MNSKKKKTHELKKQKNCAKIKKSNTRIHNEKKNIN